MLQNLEIIPKLYFAPLWMSVATQAPPLTPVTSSTTFVFSGTQFFVALVAGLLMAFAFQFLLTNLSLATGISAQSAALKSDSSDSSGVPGIKFIVGIGVLISINLTVFAACFLAVKLTLINSIAVGAITGVVIWSAFFLVLLWLSSKSIGSLVGTVVDTASSGLQGVIGIATTALGGKAVNDKIVNTVEESVASVRREISSAVDPTSIRSSLENYVGGLKSPQLNLQEIGSKFENLLKSSNLQTIIEASGLKNFDRETLKQLVSNSTGLSELEIDQITDSVPNFGSKDENEQQSESSSPTAIQSLGEQIIPNLSLGNQTGSTLANQGIKYVIAALFSAVFNRAEIGKQLKQLPEKLNQISDTNDRNTIKADVKDYLLDSQPWHLNRETIKREFHQVIYDSEANPSIVLQQLEQIDRGFFIGLLQQREEFDPDRIEMIAQQLEEIRQDVLAQVKSSQSQQESDQLRSQIENYLGSLDPENLNLETIEQDFQNILQNIKVKAEQISTRLSQFDRNNLQTMLSQVRQDWDEQQTNQILERWENVRESVVSQAETIQEQAQSKAEELGIKVETYLRETGKEELQPEGIKQDLQELVDQPQQGATAIRERLAQFDRDTLVQLLSQREDLSEAQINQFVDRFLTVRDSLLHAPQKLAGKAKEEYEQVKHKIVDYLQSSDLDQLDSQRIQQKLKELLDDSQAGVAALKDRLGEVDRDTLVKTLAQRGDVSEDKIDEIVDNIQNNINQIIKTPRRLADRSVKQVQSWEAQLEDYLRQTEKSELNPQGIKRDLQTLIQQPGLGLKQLQTRFSKLDGDTLRAMLSQREDISEQEANQIVEQIESVRDSILEQAKQTTEQAQAAVDTVFEQIRSYLDSIDLPELNYEEIKQEVQQLFEDSEAGFEQLRLRLSQFDRDTLVSILGSNSALSEADADQAIGKIEQVRDRLLQQAEQIQSKTQQQIERLQNQAQKQIQQTTKVAAIAAWWLFGTALTSMGMAAFAGIVAVRGFNF